MSGRAFQSQPRYSPDGRSLVFISDESGSDNVWLTDRDGGNARALTDLPRAILFSPAWARDGRSIFVSVISDDGPRSAEIWRYDTSSGEGRLVAANDNGRPSPLVSSPAPGSYGPVPWPEREALLYTAVTPAARRPNGAQGA